jgi:hypothetical protein
MAIDRTVDRDFSPLAAVFALIEVSDVDVVLVRREAPGQRHGGRVFIEGNLSLIKIIDAQIDGKFWDQLQGWVVQIGGGRVLDKMIIPVDLAWIIGVSCTGQIQGVGSGDILDAVHPAAVVREGNVEAARVGEIVFWDTVGVHTGAGPVLESIRAEVGGHGSTAAIPDATRIINVDALGVLGITIP